MFLIFSFGFVALATVTLQAFSGSHHDIGVQQGRVVRQSVREALDRMPNFETIRLMKPKLMPTSLFLALAKRRAAKLLRNDIFEYYPKQAERLKGCAEGAGLSMNTLLFMLSLELLVGRPSYVLQACTCLGFSPQRTATGEAIVAKNFDYLNDLGPYQLTCETKPQEGYRTLGSKIGPQPGMLDGMNEHGLAVCYNLAYTTETPSCYAPLSFALQEMLETCRNTEQAVEFITKAKQGGHDALLTIADSEGSMKTVELTPNHAAVREMSDNQIVNTNHFLTSQMQHYEIPHNAVYSGKVPKEMLGVIVHQSSEVRLKRAQELLKRKSKIDEGTIVKVLRDHGAENKPSMLTICRHAEFASTLRSVMFNLNEKTIKVVHGNPCQNEYAEFAFS